MKKSSKFSSAAVIVLFAVAVIFFISIIIVANVFSDPYEDLTPDNGFKIASMDVDIEWKNDRSCHVKETINAEFNDPSHGIYVDIPVNSGEKVRNLTATATAKARRDGVSLPSSCEYEYESMYNIVRIVVGDADRYLYSGGSMCCEVEYDYITPVHPDGANILDINAIGKGWTCRIESAVVSVTYPAAPNSQYGSGVYVGNSAADAVTVSNGGKTYTVTVGKLNAFEGVRFKHEMPRGVLVQRSDTEWIAIVAVGVALLAAAILLMIFAGKDKQLTPVVGFYPPFIYDKNYRSRRMLPVQMGKIIDGTCSSEDVTSLIFYWASKGYLSIEEGESEDDITFVMGKKLDPVTAYESKLYHALFRNADEGEDGVKRVKLSSITGSFAANITNAKNAVNAEYRGKLYRGGYTALSIIMTVCCALFGVIAAVFSSFRVAVGLFNVVGVLTVVPVVLAAALGAVLSRNYIKLTKNKRIAFTVLMFIAVPLLAVATTLAVPTNAMSWAEKFVLAFSVGISSALAPFLTRRTDEYSEMLNDIVGFRNFLRDAQKDELETMLADDPQYYYEILPYANVLGVSDIWADKFKDLTIAPPTYYYGRSPSLFDVYVISRVHRSIGSSLTYTPPKASSGSFSGGHFGGGGGHSGGSFGGFGGGGGGRW